jgi:hypothetical protein
MAPYDEAVFQQHLTAAWEKWKNAETQGEQNYWVKVMEMLHADFEMLEATWRTWNSEGMTFRGGT